MSQRSWELPQVLPIGWTRGPDLLIGGVHAATFSRPVDLGVLCSVEQHESGEWLHVSLSRRSRLPSWDDVRAVKDLFVGRDRVAVQVLPRDEEYVNVHQHTLHLWAGLEGQQVLPDDALPRRLR